MNSDKLYRKGLQLCKTKKFDKALEIAKKLQLIAPKYKNAYVLEADIWNARNKSVNEYRALEKIVPLLDTSTPEGKNFAVKVFYDLNMVCIKLALPDKSVKYNYLVMTLIDKKFSDYHMIATAAFYANCSEYFSDVDFRILYKELKKYFSDIVPYPKKFYDHERIRIGYLSADLNRHSVMNWAWDLVTGLDRKKIDVYLYSNTKEHDHTTDMIRKTPSVWRDITKLTDEEAAKLIRDDEIDILFDLNGYTSDYRIDIAAYKPASVQMSGIGYMNSTGLDCFDYFLSDVWLTGDTAATSKYFTEKVIQMPHCHICFSPLVKADIVPVPPCRRKGYVTFGSFNNWNKVTDSMLRAWKKILDAVPNSRLLLKTKIFVTEDGKKFVAKRLQRVGIDLSRVKMRSFSKNYLVEYNDMDIALDTFPYTGGVTTCEALYMGVPVVSLYGDRPGSRFGLSILKNVGLDELAVDSYDEYIQRAVALANDWELLTILRQNLRGMMERSPLMDAKGYVRDIERVFIAILDAERKNS